MSRSPDEARDYPPTFAVRAVWNMARGAPKSFAMLANGLHLRGRLDVAALREALALLVARHEALRASFPPGDGGPIARVAAHGATELIVVDVADADAARRFAQDLSADGVDIEHGPLHRFLLCRIDEEEHHFYIVAHHIITDGRSVQLLFTELRRLYDACIRRLPSPLPPARSAFAFARQQASWFDAETRARYEAFWQPHLRARAAPPMRAMRPKPVGQMQSRCATYRAPLAVDLRRLAEQAERQLGASLRTRAVVALAALNALQLLESDERGAKAELFVANRTNETFGMVGNFINILPLHVEMSAELRFSELRRIVAQRMDEVLAYGDGPMPMSFGQPPDGADYRVWFQYVGRPPKKSSWNGLEASELAAMTPAKKAADVELAISDERGVESELVVRYNAELIDEPIANAWIDRYRGILSAVLRDDELTIAALGTASLSSRRGA